MLNKEICQKCCSEDSIVDKSVFADQWGSGWIFCKRNRAINSGSHVLPYLNIEGSPPERCPYILEHLMEDQQDVK